VVCVLAAVVFPRELPELRRWARPIYVQMGISPEIAEGVLVTSDLTRPPEE